jgi:hypothetical protein
LERLYCGTAACSTSRHNDVSAKPNGLVEVQLYGTLLSIDCLPSLTTMNLLPLPMCCGVLPADAAPANSAVAAASAANPAHTTSTAAAAEAFEVQSGKRLKRLTSRRPAASVLEAAARQAAATAMAAKRAEEKASAAQAAAAHEAAMAALRLVFPAPAAAALWEMLDAATTGVPAFLGKFEFRS